MMYFLKILIVATFYFGYISTISVGNSTKQCTITDRCNGTSINVRWWEMKPYIYKVNNTVDGFFPKILQRLVSECCGNCIEIDYSHQVKSESGLMKNFDNISFVNFPVFGSMMDISKVRKPYLPLIESPGVVYLENNNKMVTATYHVVIKAVTKSWPILVFIYLGAALSGIAVWALDCYCNWEQFPVNFFKGSWEGFWWSIVSMTTVGYGDRCPKSTAARFFSIVWVMIGLVMIALFNGALTTELTTFSMTSSPILKGEKVAVLAGSAEERYAATIMVKKAVVPTMKDMKEHLFQEKNPHNLLVDTYVAGYWKDFLNSSGKLMLRDVLERNVAYGMLLSGNIYESSSSKMKKCFERQLSVKPHAITKTSLDLMDRDNVTTVDFSPTPIEQIKKDHLLSPFGPVPTQFYVVCSVLVGLFVIGGMIWQFRKRMNETALEIDESVLNVQDISLEELQARQNKELEEAMHDEVELFYKAWTDQKDKVFKRFSCAQWYKNIRPPDPMMAVTIDVPKYDYIGNTDKFELTSSHDNAVHNFDNTSQIELKNNFDHAHNADNTSQIELKDIKE